MIKSYEQVIRLLFFEERFKYLKLDGTPGDMTFGFDRWLNQELYKSRQWRQLRNEIIIRDAACDLAFINREIYGRLIIHHLNPITSNDIELRRKCVFDPDNLICVSLDTHNAIHYGSENPPAQIIIVERKKGDTCPWIVS